MALTIKHDGKALRLDPPWPSNTDNANDLAVITLECEGLRNSRCSMGLDRESIIVLRDALEATLRRAR